jgi:hypothetical protein
MPRSTFIPSSLLVRILDIQASTSPLLSPPILTSNLITGVPSQQKLQDLLQSKTFSSLSLPPRGFFLQTLDEIAWILNLRSEGGDVPFCPVFHAYLFVLASLLSLCSPHAIWLKLIMTLTSLLRPPIATSLSHLPTSFQRSSLTLVNSPLPSLTTSPPSASAPKPTPMSGLSSKPSGPLPLHTPRKMPSIKRKARSLRA